MTPSPEQIADLTESAYKNFLNMPIPNEHDLQPSDFYLEGYLRARTEQATTTVDDRRVAEAINNLTVVARDFSSHQSLRIRLSGVVTDLVQGLIRDKTEQATEIAELKAKLAGSEAEVEALKQGLHRASLDNEAIMPLAKFGATICKNYFSYTGWYFGERELAFLASQSGISRRGEFCDVYAPNIEATITTLLKD